MSKVKEIFDRLDPVDGILGIAVVTPEDSSTPMVPLRLHGHAIEIARLVGDESIHILIGNKGPGQRKLVACLWPDYHIAVEVIPGHPVNKSLQRILRRTGRRFGSLEVESRRPRVKPCNVEQPAISSSDPTEQSSPSPVDPTPSTGDSPEAR